MEQENHEETNTTSLLAPLKEITPVSKYLSFVLFVLLPFIGGYIGYQIGQSSTQPDRLHNEYQVAPTQEEQVQNKRVSVDHAMQSDDIIETYVRKWRLVTKGEDFELISQEKTLFFSFLENKVLDDSCERDDLISIIGRDRYDVITITQSVDFNNYDGCTIYDHGEYFVFELIRAPKIALSLLEKNATSGLQWRANKPDITIAELLDTGVYFDYRDDGYLFAYDLLKDKRTVLDMEVPVFLAYCEMDCHFPNIYKSPSHPNTLFIEIRSLYDTEILYSYEMEDRTQWLPPDTYFYPLVLDI